MHRNRNAGFTLVEMSIALVIIGLVVGGIMIGRNMLRAGEIRAVLSEHGSYILAVRTFRDKYQALPGDMPNATKFWGALDNNNTTCQTMASNDKKTCNGDGDGQVQGFTNSEKFRFWQHLSNAGLIDGHYTGVKDPLITAPKNGTPGLNVPNSKVDGVWWILENDGEETLGNGDATTAVWLQKAERFHAFIVGRNYSAYDGKGGAAFTPQEAWDMDKKVDDGKPGTGILHSTLYTNCSTATAATGFPNATYNFPNTGEVCGLVFPKAFY